MVRARPLTEPAPQASARARLVAHPPALAAQLAAALRLAGIATEIAPGWREAEALAAAPAVTVLYAEATLADLERIALAAEASAHGLIVVLAEDTEASRIASLDRGADDVLGRAVAPGELAARLRAVHRRVHRAGAVSPAPPGGVVVDPACRCLVRADGGRTKLSEAEFIALETLLDAAGAPVSREWLGRTALRRPLHADDRSVDQLVLKLRRKLAAAGAPDRTILSSRRQGYVIPDPTRLRGSAAQPPPALAPLAD